MFQIWVYEAEHPKDHWEKQDADSKAAQQREAATPQARGAWALWTIINLWKTKICVSYMVTNSFWIMFKEKTESEVHICFQISPLLHSHHYCFHKGENSLQWLSAKHQRFTCEDDGSSQVFSPRQSESVWWHSEQKLLSYLCLEEKKKN